MKNRKGFTLIELLAVIVILAIILVISVPKILDVINGARSSSRDSSVKILKDTIKTQVMASNMTNSGLFEKDSNDCYIFDFDEKNTNYQNLNLDNKDTFSGTLKYCTSGFDDSDLGFNDGTPITKTLVINSTNILSNVPTPTNSQWCVIDDYGSINIGMWRENPVNFYYKDKVTVTSSKPATITGKVSLWTNSSDNAKFKIGFSTSTDTSSFDVYQELSQNFTNSNYDLPDTIYKQYGQDFEVTITTPGEYYIKGVYYMTYKSWSAYSRIYDLKITK